MPLDTASALGEQEYMTMPLAFFYHSTDTFPASEKIPDHQIESHFSKLLSNCCQKRTPLAKRSSFLPIYGVYTHLYPYIQGWATGLEPATFWSTVRRSANWATPTMIASEIISLREVSSGILSWRYSLIKHLLKGAYRLRSGDSQLLASRQILKRNLLFGELVWS